MGRVKESRERTHQRATYRAQRALKVAGRVMRKALAAIASHDDELHVLAVQKQAQEAAMVLFQRPSRSSPEMQSFLTGNLVLLDLQTQTEQLQKKQAQKQAAEASQRYLLLLDVQTRAHQLQLLQVQKQAAESSQRHLIARFKVMMPQYEADASGLRQVHVNAPTQFAEADACTDTIAEADALRPDDIEWFVSNGTGI